MGLRDIALLAVLLALVPVAFFRPWIGVLGWTWVGLMNPHRLSWNLENLPIAMLVGAATLGGLLLTRDRKGPPWTREMVILVALAGYFTLTTLLAWYPEVSWREWETVMKILLFTVVTTTLIWSRQRIRLLLLVVVGSLGFYGVKGGVFSVTTGGQYRVWGPEGSFISGNTSIGLALCMLLPLALIGARLETSRWIRWALYAVFCLSVPAILFTYSRGALVGLLALAPFLAWRYRRSAMVLAPVVVLVGAVAVYEFIPEKWFERQATIQSYQVDYSAMQRIQAWGVALNIALDRPFRGAGFDFEEAGDTARWLSYANFVEEWAMQERAAHSVYFQVLGEHGLVAFGLYVLLLVGTFFRLNRLARLEGDPDRGWIGTYARAAQLALVPFIVAGAFLSLAYFDLFFLLVALSTVLQREAWSSEPSPAGSAERSGDSRGTGRMASPWPVGADSSGPAVVRHGPGAYEDMAAARDARSRDVRR